MLAYRRYAIVQKSKQIILSDLPFAPGQQVEVVVLVEDVSAAKRIGELRELFQATQALPQARAISEEEIAAEIAAYRSGR